MRGFCFRCKRGFTSEGYEAPCPYCGQNKATSHRPNKEESKTAFDLFSPDHGFNLPDEGGEDPAE